MTIGRIKNKHLPTICLLQDKQNFKTYLFVDGFMFNSDVSVEKIESFVTPQ